VLSVVTQAIGDLTIEAKIKRAAINITKLAPCDQDLTTILMDVIVTLIEEKKDILYKDANESEKVESLFNSLKLFCNQLKEKIEDTVWGTRFTTSQEKLGNHDATTLIFQFIANGKMFKEYPNSHLHPPAEKKRILLLFASSQSENRWKNLTDDELQKNEPTKLVLEIESVQDNKDKKPSTTQNDQSKKSCCVIS